MSRFAILIKIALGAMLVYAGALKLADTQGFALDIANYRAFASLAPWLAVTLPAIEIVTGLALVLLPLRNEWCRAAAVIALALFIVFTFAIAQALVRNINVACGCFGSGGGQASWLTVARDVCFVIVTALLVWLARKKRTLA